MLMMDPWHTEAQKRSTKTISHGNPIVHLLMKSLFSIQSGGYSPIEIGVADFPRVLYSTCSPVCFVWPEIFICARFRYYIFSEFLWHLETYRKLLVSGLWLIRSSGKSCLLVAIKLTSWFTTYFGKPKSSCLWPKITKFLVGKWWRAMDYLGGRAQHCKCCLTHRTQAHKKKTTTMQQQGCDRDLLHHFEPLNKGLTQVFIL